VKAFSQRIVLTVRCFIMQAAMVAGWAD